MLTSNARLLLNFRALELYSFWCVDPMRHSAVCLVGRNAIWPNLRKQIAIEYNAFLITAFSLKLPCNATFFASFSPILQQGEASANLYVLVQL